MPGVATNRSDQGRLQAQIGELGSVHPYRHGVQDMRHPLTGWWLTPAGAEPDCDCELCAAHRDGRDVHLGSIARTAIYEAGRLALAHREP